MSPSFYLVPWLDRKLLLRSVREAAADANKGPLPLNPSLGYIFASGVCFIRPRVKSKSLIMKMFL